MKLLNKKIFINWNGKSGLVFNLNIFFFIDFKSLSMCSSRVFTFGNVPFFQHRASFSWLVIWAPECVGPLARQTLVSRFLVEFSILVSCLPTTIDPGFRCHSSLPLTPLVSSLADTVVLLSAWAFHGHWSTPHVGLSDLPLF